MSRPDGSLRQTGGRLHGAEVVIPVDGGALHGDLVIPEGAAGIVAFAHGSGSSRFSARNRMVARTLEATGLATLLIDLLTAKEEAVDAHTRELRFDIDLLARRMSAVTDWLARQHEVSRLATGYFGSSTGAAAALIAAAERPDEVGAVVSRGGRTDLAAHVLPRVRTPTLLIVGERDEPVLELNRRTLATLRCERRLEVIPGATHLFEEPGALERVAELAGAWFVDHLGPTGDARSARPTTPD